MTNLNCPFCKEQIFIDIANSISEDGEVFLCPHCRKPFRYAPNG